MADEWKYKDLPRAANGIAPAKWNPDTGEFEVYTGVNDVKAIGVEDRLTAIENKLDSVIQNGSVNTQVTGSYAEYRILSSDTFPEAKADEKGAQLIVMDTGAIYLNHGSEWKVF